MSAYRQSLADELRRNRAADRAARERGGLPDQRPMRFVFGEVVRTLTRSLSKSKLTQGEWHNAIRVIEGD